MKNVDLSITGDKLTIVVDLSKEQCLSGSGKSVVIATSEGNIPIDKDDIRLGLNVYKPIK